MVHRQLVLTTAAAALGGLLLTLAMLAAPQAGAANRRVAIGNYQWSRPQIHLDLGEHVTWYWVGPDTMHSVTGTSANDAGWDSDPHSVTPRHSIGDTFKLTFTSPGAYTFQCKLHPTVRGTVRVSENPGDPAAEPDPIPRSRVDLTPPYVDELGLASTSFTRRGTRLRFGIDERAAVDAEYYRLIRRHRGRRLRHRFAGWQQWHATVGYNDFAFADRVRHFRARPGRYVAALRFTDRSNNSAATRHLRFRIRR